MQKIDLSNASLNKLSVHYVGNKTMGDEMVLSKKSLDMDEELNLHLQSFFLKKFEETQERYHFVHETSLQYNEIYNYSTGLFTDAHPFHRVSINIAKHLYEASTHPKIKPGELYVCFFEGCLVDGEPVRVLGIFKTESKSNYFTIEPAEVFNIQYAEGIDASKFDKGCLIFNSRRDDGYVVCAIDNQGRGEDAQYWKHNFLGLVPANNEFYQTNQFLDIARQYVTKQVSNEWEVNKAQQISMLNKSLAYFKENDKFDKSDFEEKVLQERQVIKSFQKFDKAYRTENDLDLPDSFDISNQAVKKQSRIFKSVLKLDKNFHVYIHGKPEMIEKGVDADGRKFYKLYYEQEL